MPPMPGIEHSLLYPRPLEELATDTEIGAEPAVLPTFLLPLGDSLFLVGPSPSNAWCFRLWRVFSGGSGLC